MRLTAPGVEPWRFSDGAVVGIFDSNLQRPYSRTATALTDVDGLVIEGEEYYEILEDHFEDARLIIETASGSLHNLTADLPAGERFVSTAPTPTGAMVPDRPLTLVERIECLQECEAFAATPIQVLVMMAELVTEERWDAGEMVFERGEPLQSLLLVARGRVDLEDSAGTVHPFGPSSLLGGFFAFARPETEYRARAGTAALTLRVRQDDLFDVMEDHHEMIRSIFRHLTFERERVQIRNAELAAAKANDA